MIVEKRFTRAKLTGQVDRTDGSITLEIVRHPAIHGCCTLIILDSKSSVIRASITVNNSELKKVADMLCGIGDVNIDSNPYLG